MRNNSVLVRGIKNPYAEAIIKNGYSIRVDYGTHTKTFKGVEEYQPSPSEIEALDEYKKRGGTREKKLPTNDNDD